MRIVRLSELTPMRWRNGGGVTREIARAERNGALAWRLSMADVAADGPFSDFAGLVRILTVIDGAGMDLWGNGGCLPCDPWVPLRFDGGLQVEARLRGGPLRDLNLIFDPRSCESEVVVVEGPGTRRLCGAPACAIHALRGTIGVGHPSSGQEHLAPGDTALAENEIVEVIVADGAAALLITLAPADQAEASSDAIAER